MAMMSSVLFVAITATLTIANLVFWSWCLENPKDCLYLALVSNKTDLSQTDLEAGTACVCCSQPE